MKKVLLLYGGNSNEHEISCKSAEFIMENIDKKRYILDSVKINKKNEWILYNKKVNNIVELLKKYDVIFPLIHGKYGEDGKLQGMLELFKIKFVGTRSGPSYIGMDKERTKQIVGIYNISQISYKIYSKNIKVNFPVIVKPANSGSSIGIKTATNKKELTKAVKNAKKHDNKVIIEKFINAREFECAVLEDNNKLIISNVGEIISANKFYDYDAKYKNNDSKTIVPADIDNNLKNEIKDISKKVFTILDLKGFARIDFLYDIDNKILYFNEVNTIPGFTNISMYPKLMEESNINNKDIITKLIENAK